MRVEAGFFSLTAAEDDDDYLRWHLLDHMPEQFRIPGIQHGLRYIADERTVAARVAGDGPLADIGGVANYLMGAPVQATYDAFVALGRELADAGRYPRVKPSLGLQMRALLCTEAAPRVLVSPEVVPWRPHRGVVLVIEAPVVDDAQAWLEWLGWLGAHHHPAVLDVAGVAGIWQYGSTTAWRTAPRHAAPGWTTVIYVDDDPSTVAGELATLLEERWADGTVRPLFAGPMRSMVTWEVWPSP